MSGCNHPYEAREDYGYAVVSNGSEILSEKIQPARTRVLICKLCMAVLVPDGVLVDETPTTYEPRHICACGKRLTQPYAKAMGECVDCCLTRMRQHKGTGIMVYVTSNHGLRYQNSYNRTRRKAHAS